MQLVAPIAFVFKIRLVTTTGGQRPWFPFAWLLTASRRFAAPHRESSRVAGRQGIGTVHCLVTCGQSVPRRIRSGAAASKVWTKASTPLTTARLTATSQIYETTLDGASGQFSRDIALQVDHAFLTWLIGTWKAGYGNDNYTGSGLTDNRYFTSVGVTYKFNREWLVRTELREDWQTASQPGFSYTGTTVLFGVRAQR